jgi:hypothetical protein
MTATSSILKDYPKSELPFKDGSEEQIYGTNDVIGDIPRQDDGSQTRNNNQNIRMP